MSDRFIHAINLQKTKTEASNPLIAGTLGIYINGQQVVEVPDRPSYVYVQVRSSSAEVIQAFNARVSPTFGLPVLIQWQGNRYIIYDRDSLRYSNWQDFSAFLPRHASTHEFAGSAGDLVFVSSQQFLPLMPMPSGSLGTDRFVVNEYLLQTTSGTFIYFPPQATVSFSPWKPLTTGAIMALVTLDSQNGGFGYQINSGSVFSNSLTGTSQIAPFIPAVSDLSRYVPIAAVRLTSDMTTISWDNLYDARPFFGATRSLGGGGGGGGGGSTTGAFLKLDTSNGPLTGPLVITQSNPNAFNQYFDYSNLVAFLSGTNSVNFGAAVEAVVWSTGGRSYGIYIDDEGAGGNSMFIGQQGIMDVPAFRLDSYINGFSNTFKGRFFSNTVLWNRYGNNAAVYDGAFFKINQNAPNQDAQPGIELDVNNSLYTMLNPAHSGTRLLFPNPFSAPYHFDTFRAIPSGMVLMEVLNNSDIKFWIANSGLVTSREGFNIYGGGTYNINGIPHTHVITGAAFSGPFPQPVFGFFGENNGVPLGSGTTLNIRGQNYLFTISGTTFDLFLTGTAGGGGGAGVDQIGIFGENRGVPLGTGTILNVRGNGNAILSLSGTTLDLFVTGSPFPQEVIGFFGENGGIPLGTGSILNVRGATLTISGTTFDLFVTGTAPVFPQPVFGIFGENVGVPLGTGTILNVRGQNAALSISGTTLDLFVTGTLPSGPSGGDLTGTYPNPQILWQNGTGYYGTLYANRIHAPQHESGGFDPLPLDMLAPPIYPLGNYLDTSTGSHGLMRKLSGDPTKYIGGDGLEHDLPAVEEYYLDDSSLVTGTKALLTSYPTGSQATLAQAITSTTTGTVFAIPFLSVPGPVDFMGAQETRILITANITAGTKITYLYAQFLKYSASGTEVLLGTSNLQQISTSVVEYDLGMAIQDTFVDPTERLELKFWGLGAGAGGNPTITIYYDGSTSSRLEVGGKFRSVGNTVNNFFNGMYGENQGIPLGTGSILNVNGSRLNMTISGTTLNLTNSPDPVELIGVYGQQAGQPIGTGTVLNFRGSPPITVSLSGTVLDVFVTGSPFPQEVIGFFGESAGVPLGTGTILNVRGPAASFTISGSTLDLFVTGVPTIPVFPQPVMGVFGESAGTPLGTGTIFNVRGPAAVFTISGTTLDLFVTGVPTTPVFPQEVIGIYGEQNGAPLGTGSTLNVRGPMLSMTISGTVLDLFATGVAPVYPQPVLGVFGENQGVPLGTGTIVNFRGPNVTTTISGTALDVFVTGTLIPWNIVTTTGGVNMVPNQDYLANNPQFQIALNMPNNASVGDMLRVVGMNTGTWIVKLGGSGTGEVIHFLHRDTSKGTGTLSANSSYDSIQMVCVLQNREWVVISSVGNIGMQ